MNEQRKCLKILVVGSGEHKQKPYNQCSIFSWEKNHKIIDFPGFCIQSFWLFSWDIIQFDQTKSDPLGEIHSSIAESTQYRTNKRTNSMQKILLHQQKKTRYFKNILVLNNTTQDLCDVYEQQGQL